MINSISNSSSSILLQSNSMQQQPPPPGKNAFQVADSDANGIVSGDELEAVLVSISETTGTTLDSEEILSTYDTDLDEGLSGEEMLNLLTDQGFGPPQEVNGEAGGPPPPPPMDQALASYAENSGEDLLSQLLAELQTAGSDAEESSLDIST